MREHQPHELDCVDSGSVGGDEFSMTNFFSKDLTAWEEFKSSVPIAVKFGQATTPLRHFDFRYLLIHTCHKDILPSHNTNCSPLTVSDSRETKLTGTIPSPQLTMTTRSIATRLSQSLQAPAARAFSSSSRAAQAPVPKPTKPASQTQPSLPPTPTSQLEQIKQYPAHPLLQFFRTYSHELNDKALGGTAVFEEASKDSISAPKYYVNLPHAVHQNDLGRDANSRSWLASELRLKSSKDLHTLWYVLLMERNRLATAWEELHRVGARQAARMWSQSLGRKNHRVSSNVLKKLAHARQSVLVCGSLY